VLRPASIRQWAPRYRGVRSLSRFAPRGLYLLGGVALAGLLVFAYTGVSWRYQLWSDHASTVLAGLDMLRGNWNLEGWSLATHSLWSTEIPVYALALFVRGFTPALMHEVPAVLYAALVGATCWTAAQGMKPRGRIVAASVPFVLVGLPSAQTNFPNNLQGFALGVGGSHVGTSLFVIVAIALFAGWRAPIIMHSQIGRGWWQGWPRGAGAVVALAFAIAGDPSALVIGLLPVLTEAVTSWIRKGAAVGLVGLGYCTMVGAVASVMLNVRGFVTLGLGADFVSWDQLGANLSLTIHGMLNLFGADFFGQNMFGVGTAILLLHLLGLVLVVWAGVRALRRWVKGTDDDWISTVLALACLFNILAYTGSTLPTSFNTTRYLSATVFFGATLAGRTAGVLVGEWDGHKIRTAVLAIAGYAAIALVSFLLVFSRPIAGAWPEGIPQLVEWLSAKQLHHGWGVYRASSIVTVESRGYVTIRPVESDLNQCCLSRSRWYSETAPEFIVWGVREDIGSINLQAITDAFGPPKAIFTVGAFRVAVLRHR